jgi:hypothetical protein
MVRHFKRILKNHANHEAAKTQFFYLFAEDTSNIITHHRNSFHKHTTVYD